MASVVQVLRTAELAAKAALEIAWQKGMRSQKRMGGVESWTAACSAALLACAAQPTATVAMRWHTVGLDASLNMETAVMMGFVETLKATVEWVAGQSTGIAQYIPCASAPLLVLPVLFWGNVHPVYLAVDMHSMPAHAIPLASSDGHPTPPTRTSGPEAGVGGPVAGAKRMGADGDRDVEPQSGRKQARYAQSLQGSGYTQVGLPWGRWPESESELVYSDDDPTESEAPDCCGSCCSMEGALVPVNHHSGAMEEFPLLCRWEDWVLSPFGRAQAGATPRTEEKMGATGGPPMVAEAAVVLESEDESWESSCSSRNVGGGRIESSQANPHRWEQAACSSSPMNDENSNDDDKGDSPLGKAPPRHLLQTLLRAVSSPQSEPLSREYSDVDEMMMLAEGTSDIFWTALEGLVETWPQEVMEGCGNNSGTLECCNQKGTNFECYERQGASLLYKPPSAPRVDLTAQAFQPKAVRGRSMVPSASGQYTSVPLLDKDSGPAFISDVDTLLFDCDGVLWRGNTMVPGADKALLKFRSMGKRLLFVTNNASKSREKYVSKFKGMGLDVKSEEIIAASYAAAAYLDSINFKKKVFLIGNSGVEDELKLHGIPYVGGKNFDVPFMGDMNALSELKVDSDIGAVITVDPDIGAVIVGWDPLFSYSRLVYASICLREIPGCLFVATNPDHADHIGGGRMMPGTGGLVAAVELASGVKPLVVGKGGPWLLPFLCSKCGLTDPSKAAIIGDRLDTDIALGREGGLRAILTLTGVSTLEEAQSS
eukprot:gene6189-2806_t